MMRLRPGAGALLRPPNRADVGGLRPDRRETDEPVGSVFQLIVFNETDTVRVSNPTPGLATMDREGVVTVHGLGDARFDVRYGRVRMVLRLLVKTPVAPPPPPVSTAMANFRDARRAELLAMVDGLPGGALNMDVFSALDHGAKSYTRNPAQWAQAVVGQLASAVAYKATSMGTKESYGGILITPRHVLYCNHAKPHAEGTWIHPTSPLWLRWVLGDGTLVEAVQVAQTGSSVSLPGYYQPSDGVRPDLCVATLDRDVAALGVPVMPILRYGEVGQHGAANTADVPYVHVSQGTGRSTKFTPPTPISDFPQYHRAMVTIGRDVQQPAPLDDFNYLVWDGDSGTPAMLLYEGQLYLERIMLYGGGFGAYPGTWLGHINEMIATADADAVARGKLAQATSLTVAGALVEIPN